MFIWTIYAWCEQVPYEPYIGLLGLLMTFTITLERNEYSKESFSSYQETGKVFSPEMPFYSKF